MSGRRGLSEEIGRNEAVSTDAYLGQVYNACRLRGQQRIASSMDVNTLLTIERQIAKEGVVLYWMTDTHRRGIGSGDGLSQRRVTVRMHPVPIEII
jgi:peptidyl-tRNA hydrolase